MGIGGGGSGWHFVLKFADLVPDRVSLVLFAHEVGCHCETSCEQRNSAENRGPHGLPPYWIFYC
jgi:hypothetical protein